MFALAESSESQSLGMKPFWVYEGSTKVERRVLSLPYSKEIEKLVWLRKSLAKYRLAFGQPRQSDLLEYLNALPEQDIGKLNLSDLQIKLSPPG